MRPLLLLTTLVPAAIVPAQIVSPTHFNRSEGNVGLTDGLGSTFNQSRFLQLIKMRSGQRTVNGIAVRRDGSPTGKYPSFALVADIYISQAAKSYPTHNIVFDENHGPDKMKASDVGVFVFPETEPGPIPSPWAYRFTFDTPYVYPGTKPVAWEVVTHYRTNPQQVVFDGAANWDDNPAPQTNAFGTGCVASGQTAPATLGLGATSTWSRNEVQLTYDGTNLPPASPALLAIGGDTASFGGLTLPFVLPGSQIGPSGACTIYNDWVVTLPVTTDPSGGFTQQLDLDVRLATNGTTLFAQVLAVDPGVNVFGAVLSNGTTANMVRPFSSTLQISYSFVSGSHAPSGQRVRFQGLVVQIF